MFPSVAYLYVCPVNMDKYLNETIKYWSDYNGMNFESIGKVYAQMLLEKPLIETIQPEQLIDEEKLLASLDLSEITLDDIKSIHSFNIDFTANRDLNQLHGFAFWFEVVFRCDKDEIVSLSTSPSSEPTHWKQTIAFLPDALQLIGKKDKEDQLRLCNGDAFECFVLMNQSEGNERMYEIEIGVDLNSKKEEEKYDNDDDDDDVSEEDSEEEDHPIPCNCGSMRCILIKATLDKYESQNK